MVFVGALGALCCASAACATGASGPEAPQVPATPVEAVPPSAADRIASPVDSMPQPPINAQRSQPSRGDWVESTLASLTLRQKVGQMLMPFVLGDYAPEGTPAHDRIVREIEQHEIGGVIVSVGTPTDVAVKLNDLQQHSRLPLLVAADLETGAGFRLTGAVHLPTNIVLGGATNFPPPMAVGATGEPGFAYEMGRVTALEARAVGIHVPFAPVLDVNNNPDNPIINTRSFGEDPDRVGELGRAFIRGMQEHGALATGKHFPGHGDTDTDSHLELPVIRATRARLDSIELKPFQAAIASGLKGMMTAHIAMPEITGSSDIPATLSRPVLTGLLRDEMGFDGLIFTDAMDMRAIDRRFPRGEATVRAIEAGADVILMPPSVPDALEAVINAVQSGRIAESRVDASVRRILQAKEDFRLHEEREVSLSRVPQVVGIPEHEALADELARRSLTLLRNEGDLLPLAGTRTARVLSVSLRRPNDLLAGRTFNATLRRTYPRLTTAEVTRDEPSSVYDALLRQASSSSLVVVSLYVSWNSYSDQLALPDEMIDFVSELGRRSIPHVVVSFGNPYLLREIPSARSYLLAWSSSAPSQRAAAEGLFGTFAVTGRTPTKLPPFFEIGDGITLPGPTVTSAINGRATAEPAMVQGGDLIPESFAAESPPAEPAVGPASVNVWAPAAVALDARLSERLDNLMSKGIADGAAPGAALAVGRRGRLVHLQGYGVLDPVVQTPVDASTVYDLASLTKVIGTTTAVMLLVDEGRLSLEDRVIDHMPGWDRGDARKGKVTVEQLLLHRAGFAPFRQWFFEMAGRDAYRAALDAEPLETDPGTATVYSDLGVISLGLVVEAVAGRPLDEFLRERVFEPLGMHDTRFNPPLEWLERIAPTEVDSLWRGAQAWGRVHDENAEAMGGVSGHAGLFSTAVDLAVFADLMLREGVVPPCSPGDGSAVPCAAARPDSVRLIRAETVRRFVKRFDESSSRALGWDTPEGVSSAGDFFSERSYGHTGYTGTSLWIDPARDLFVVFLSNRVNPTRANQRHVPLRRAVHDEVARAVSDQPVELRGGR